MATGLVASVPLAVHYGVVNSQPGPALVLLLLLAVPVLLAATWPARAAGLLIASGLILASMRLADPAVLLYLCPILINGALALVFARSLLPGRTPLITAFVRMQYGTVHARRAEYTRTVTQAWAVFLGLMALEAAMLAVFASPAVWSLFANGINYLLVFAFFIGEYAVRRRVLRDMEHASFTQFLSSVAKTDFRRLVRS